MRFITFALLLVTALSGQKIDHKSQIKNKPVFEITDAKYKADPAALDNTAAIRAAINDAYLVQGSVYIPAGTYSYSGTLTIPAGVSFIGVNRSNSILVYTGAGVAITTSYGADTGIGLSNFKLVLPPVATIGIQVFGYEITVDNVWIYGGSSTSKQIFVKEAGPVKQSGKIYLRHISLDSYLGIGIQLMNVIDAYVTDIESYGSPSNTTSRSLVIDSGCSGVNVYGFKGGYSGLHGVHVTNSVGGLLACGSLGNCPNYIWMDQVIADCSAGGDAVLFDSSLGAGAIYANYTNSWAAGAGINCADGTTTTTLANGIHISGGTAINISNARIRSNADHGVLIDNSNVRDVNLHDSFIMGNNYSNNADGNGIQITNAPIKITIHDNYVGNPIETTGHQVNGLKISAHASDYMNIHDNDFGDNTVAALTNASTGTHNRIFHNGPFLPDQDAINMNGPITLTGTNNTFTGGNFVLGANANFTLVGGSPLINFNPSTFMDYDRAALSFYFVDNGNLNFAIAQNGDIASRGKVSAPAISANYGATIVYKCTGAGALPIGALTTTAASCGGSIDSGLRVP